MINLREKVSPLFADLHSFRSMPRSGRARAYGSSVLAFFRNLHLDFHCGWTNLLFHQKYIGFVFPTSLPEFVVIYFLDDNHSDWGKMESQSHFDHFENVKPFTCC
jgi:hypothetical protein